MSPICLLISYAEIAPQLAWPGGMYKQSFVVVPCKALFSYLSTSRNIAFGTAVSDHHQIVLKHPHITCHHLWDHGAFSTAGDSFSDSVLLFLPKCYLFHLGDFHCSLSVSIASYISYTCLWVCGLIDRIHWMERYVFCPVLCASSQALLNSCS